MIYWLQKAGFRLGRIHYKSNAIDLIKMGLKRTSVNIHDTLLWLDELLKWRLPAHGFVFGSYNIRLCRLAVFVTPYKAN